jgi:hypothetical protein
MAYFDANGLTLCITIEHDKITATGKELNVNFAKKLEDFIKFTLKDIKSVFFRSNEYETLVIECITQNGVRLLELLQENYGNDLRQKRVETIKRRIDALLEKNILSGEEYEELESAYETDVLAQVNAIKQYMSDLPKCTKSDIMNVKDVQKRIEDLQEDLNIFEMEKAELKASLNILKIDVKKATEQLNAMNRV